MTRPRLRETRAGALTQSAWDVLNPKWDPRPSITTETSGRRIDSATMHITGLAFMWVAVSLAISAAVEIGYGDPDAMALLAASGILGGVGYLLSRLSKAHTLDTAGSFAVVGWTWVLTCLAGALPYILAGTFRHWDDAVFESVSGFSCTGSTVFFGYNEPISAQGHGVLLYRQFTNWAGGMGIVLLALTVLPSLGRGGLGLIGAEAPGPSSEHMVPNLNTMAKRLWYLYLGITVLLAGLYLAVGMGPFDAVAHGLSTAATGGFSTQDSSIGSFESIWIEAAVVFGMFLGGANFALHYRFAMREYNAYTSDGEFRIYFRMIVFASLVVGALLWLDSPLTFSESARAGIFNTVALGTSTGFSNATNSGSPGDFVTWIPAPQIILLGLFVVGGCAGSTSGGMKVVRIQILRSYVHRFLQRIRHRNLVLPIKVNGTRLADPLVEKVVGFTVLYAVIVVIGIVVVTALGADLMTAVGGVVGSMGNMGPALGDAGPTASFIDGFSRPARMVLAVLMLIGRLEIFPMLLMLVAPRRVYRRLRPHERLE